MKITDFALKNRTTVYVLMFVIFVMGALSYITLPREAAPDIEIPYVFVTTAYEGVSPEDMETLVTMKIEKELKGIKDVKTMQSSSIEGLSSIFLEFTPDIKLEDAVQKVRDKVDIAKNDLPADLPDDPTVSEINISEFPVIQVSLTGDKDLVRLKYVAEQIQDRIETLPGVLEVDLLGGLEREIRIEFDPDRLVSYNIEPTQAIMAITQNNLNIPTGSLELGDAKYNVKVPGEFKDPEEIDNIVIAIRNNKPVYLLDVAEVKDDFEERSTYARLNGTPCVTLAVSKRVGENIIQVCDGVKEIMKRAEEQFPIGMTYTVTGDQSKDIRQMVSDLENNILSGMLLITVVIFLALGVRDAALVSFAVPFSMLITFAVLSMLGISLNMIVLFSLILSVGMMVDNAIVIVENIHRHHHQEGLRRVAAAAVATREVAWPITTSCLTTVAAFVPLLFWPGIMGEFMGYLPRTVIITLFASLFVALVITPCMATVIMKKEADSGPGHKSKDFTKSFIGRSYKSALGWMLDNRWSVVVMAGGMLVISISWFGNTGLGLEFFPESEPPQAAVRIELPEGSSLDASDKVVRQIEEICEQYPENKAILSNVGGGTGGDIFGGGGASTNQSDITIEFIDREERNMKSSEVVTELREKTRGFAGVDISVEKAENGPPTGDAIAIEISGDNFETLGEISKDVEEVLNGIPGVVDVSSDYVRGKPELRVNVDKEKAAMLGLTTNMVGQMVRTAIQGSKAGVYRVGNDEYDVVVRLPEANRNEIDTLERLRIPNLSGQMIPLSSVAELEWTSGLGGVSRVDERRTVTIRADAAKGYNANKLRMQADRILSEREFPAGYTFSFGGENEEQENAMAFLGKAFLTTLFLIAIILVMQFDSLILPFVILSSVILSLIGVFLGLITASMPFGIIMTGIGVISLAGVVVNNSIVLIDYIEMLHKRGLEIREAVIEACTIRFRPVMLTAITTILGLLPMASGISFDFRAFKWVTDTETTELWQPMAIAVIFGLGVATVLTLGVLPSLYMILNRLRSTRNQEILHEQEAFLHGGQPEVEGA